MQAQVWDNFLNALTSMEGVVGNILATVLTLAILLLLRWTLLRLAYRRWDDARIRYRTRKFTGYLGVVLGILALGLIWSDTLRNLSTVLGLLSAGLAIALSDLVASAAGWCYLVWQRPFEVGDRIQVGPHAGDVIDIRVFRFTLMEIGNWVEADQSTGRTIHIPNSLVLSDMIANYSRGFQYIWNELAVLVTFESNWEAAKEILQEMADRHSAHLTADAAASLRKASEQSMVFYSVLTPKVWTSIEESGVQLTIRYLCDPKRRRSTAENIWEDILREFHRRTDIDFAYPTIRRYQNPAEGKPGTGGPLQRKEIQPLPSVNPSGDLTG